MNRSKLILTFIGATVLVLGFAFVIFQMGAEEEPIIIERDIFVDIPTNLCDIEGNPSITIKQLYDEDDVVPVEIDYFLSDKTILHGTYWWLPDGNLETRTAVISGTHSLACP